MNKKGIIFSIDAIFALLLVIISSSFFLIMISSSTTDITNEGPFFKEASSKALVQGVYGGEDGRSSAIDLKSDDDIKYGSCTLAYTAENTSGTAFCEHN